MRFYLDASIWRDFYENRADKFRPIGEWALLFLNSGINNRDFVLYSDLVVRELAIKYSQNEIHRILQVIGQKGLLLKVEIFKHQPQESGKLSKAREVPFANALHAILARDNCAVMVTRDKHFLLLTDIVSVKKPEELF